jgi:hypothetical protein
MSGCCQLQILKHNSEGRKARGNICRPLVGSPPFPLYAFPLFHFMLLSFDRAKERPVASRVVVVVVSE